MFNFTIIILKIFFINLIINDFKVNLKSLIYKCTKVSLKL
jgi:hypothetical protein